MPGWFAYGLYPFEDLRVDSSGGYVQVVVDSTAGDCQKLGID